MSNRYGPRIVTDGLVLCLDAADRNSYPGTGTSWGDLSGNGNNATLANTPSYYFANKGFFGFDGTNEKAYTSTTIAPATGDFTACFAYQLTGTGGRGGLFERKQTNPYNGWSFGQGGSGSWSFNVSGTSNFSNFIKASFTYPTTYTWYVDCGVYENGNTVTIYRNGLYVDSTTGSSQGDLSSQGTIVPLRVASRDDSSIYLPSRVAYVMIYNKALSSDEILQNYNATKGRFGL